MEPVDINSRFIYDIYTSIMFAIEIIHQMKAVYNQLLF